VPVEAGGAGKVRFVLARALAMAHSSCLQWCCCRVPPSLEADEHKSILHDDPNSLTMANGEMATPPDEQAQADAKERTKQKKQMKEKKRGTDEEVPPPPPPATQAEAQAELSGVQMQPDLNAKTKGEVEPYAKAEGSGEKGSAGNIPFTDARRAKAADANSSTDDPTTMASADQVPELEAEPEPDVHPSTEPEAASQNDDVKEGASEQVAKKQQQAPPQEEAKARKVRFIYVCVLPVLHVRV